MAEVEGSDGNNYNIPDFALEDTQEKILAIMKRSYKLTDEEIKNAQKALNNDNKNTKAQLDALSKLGDDIKDAVGGKGTFFSGLTDAATGTVSVLSSMTKIGGGVVAGLTALGVSLATTAIYLTKGFGDALEPLAKSGAAFGELGEGLRTIVPNMMSFGLSLENSVATVDMFRREFTVLGAGATQKLIKEHLNGKKNRRLFIWSLLNFNEWIKEFE